MPKYKLVVISKPTAGREAEYNDWYENVHLRDVVACGFKAAQRFRLSENISETAPLPYLAIYEAETDNPKALLQELTKRAGTAAMMISEALDTNVYGGLYEEFGKRVEA